MEINVTRHMFRPDSPGDEPVSLSRTFTGETADDIRTQVRAAFVSDSRRIKTNKLLMPQGLEVEARPVRMDHTFDWPEGPEIWSDEYPAPDATPYPEHEREVMTVSTSIPLWDEDHPELPFCVNDMTEFGCLEQAEGFLRNRLQGVPGELAQIMQEVDFAVTMRVTLPDRKVVRIEAQIMGILPVRQGIDDDRMDADLGEILNLLSADGDETTES